MRLRLWVWTICAVLALIMTGMVGWTFFNPRQPFAAQQTTGVATLGGPFTLVGTDGEAVTDKAFLGKPTAYFFGFTYCPEVCPTTLYELTARIAELGEDADKMNFVFISVDFGRDGPEQIKNYLSSFDQRIVGLTGSEAQIDTAAKAFRIYYKRVPVEGGEYTMDHTASVLLMDAEGKFFGTISYEESPEIMLAKLRRLTEEG